MKSKRLGIVLLLLLLIAVTGVVFPSWKSYFLNSGVPSRADESAQDRASQTRSLSISNKQIPDRERWNNERDLKEAVRKIGEYIESSEVRRIVDRAEGSRPMAVNGGVRARFKVPADVGTIHREVAGVLVRRATEEEAADYRAFAVREMDGLAFLTEQDRQRVVEETLHGFDFEKSYKIVNFQTIVDHTGTAHRSIGSYNAEQVMEWDGSEGVFLTPDDDMELEDLGTPEAYRKRYEHLDPGRK